MQNRIIDILKVAKQKLKSHKINCYSLEAELLLAHLLLQDDRMKIIGILDQKVDQEVVSQFFNLVERRLKNEPISQILGKKEFWDLEFTVTQDTLTPRSDTETIIEQVLKYFPKLDISLNILDMGTGSGCLAITLASLFVNSQVTAVDISQKALEVARKNALINSLDKKIKFIESNWFANVDKQKFDIIVCNPPYIPYHDLINLMPEVREFEPKTALTDFRDGYQHYRAIALKLKDYLTPQGMAFFEIGINQTQQVIEIFQAQSFRLINIAKDLSSIDRCLVFSF